MAAQPAAQRAVEACGQTMSMSIARSQFSKYLKQPEPTLHARARQAALQRSTRMQKTWDRKLAANCASNRVVCRNTTQNTHQKRTASAGSPTRLPWPTSDKDRRLSLTIWSESTDLQPDSRVNCVSVSTSLTTEKTHCLLAAVETNRSEKTPGRAM